MPLQAQYSSLNDVFANNRLFAVANYQRRYEWTVKEMDQLLDDLNSSFADSKSAPGTYHFIGSFIFQSNGTGPVEIVDGQQRLISLSILLAVGRDLIGDNAVVKDIDAYITIPAGLAGPSPQRRLRLHRGDESYFDNNIVPLRATLKLDDSRLEDEGHDRFRRNAMRAREWLEPMSQANRQDFIRFVTSRCQVIQISVDETDDAFQIFETVNNRGRPISNEDVLRFAIVEHATADPAKRAQLLQKWDDFEIALGTEGLNSFIAQWRQQFLKGRRSNKSLKHDILSGLGSPEETLAFLEKELSADVTTYTEIASGDVHIEDDSDSKLRIDKALVSLGLTDFEEWQAIANVFVERFRAAPPTLAAHLAGLDRLAWYFYLRNDAKGIDKDRRERFAAVLAQLTASTGFDPSTAAFELSIGEKAQMRDILQERIDPKWAPLRSLLTRIEVSLRPENLHLSRDAVSVEHVLPRNPRTKEWKTLYGDDRRKIRENAEMLGNLCAVPPEINRLLDDKNFGTKKKILQRHRVEEQFATVKTVLSAGSWTEKSDCRPLAVATGYSLQ